MIDKYRNELIEIKEFFKEEIERRGIFLFSGIILLILLLCPFMLVYYLIINPLIKSFRLFAEAHKLGFKASYKKQFYPDQYEKEQRAIKDEKDKCLDALFPKGKHKLFMGKENWPDAYTVDGIAVYGAEGRTLLYINEDIKEFDVPEGVVNLYHYSFAGCESLQRISLPSSLKRIGNRAFYGCVSLKEIVVPESVNIIGNEVFMHCSSLEHVVLPSETIEITTRLFYNCRNMKNFCIPTAVKTINEEAFRCCFSLEHIGMNSQLELIKERAFKDCCSLKEFIMPESVKAVTEGILNGCHSLQHIHFSSQIKDFGGSCCQECWNINKISMTPLNAEQKAHYKKWWEENAEMVDISKSECPYPESLFWTMDDTLYFGIPRLTSVCLVFCFSKRVEYTIPSFVTNIKSQAFSSCRNLQTLRLSPYIKTSSNPWESNSITCGFIYDNWPQVKNIIFDENLKHTKYAFGLIA